jgi:predicted dehydrogenase
LTAVAAGKHVVCEKPFARDKSEARQMLAAAEQAGIVHLVGTEYRWGAAQGLATRAIAEGACPGLAILGPEPFADGVAAMAVIDAIRQSAAAGGGPPSASTPSPSSPS